MSGGISCSDQLTRCVMGFKTYMNGYEAWQRPNVSKEAHRSDRRDDCVDLVGPSLSLCCFSRTIQPTVSPLNGLQTTARYFIVYSATPLPGTTRPSDMTKESRMQTM